MSLCIVGFVKMSGLGSPIEVWGGGRRVGYRWKCVKEQVWVMVWK